MIQSYPIDWFKRVVLDRDAVEASVAINDHEVRLDRKNRPSITVIPVSSDSLSLEDLESIMAAHQPTLVVLINRTGHYAWDARTYAEEQGAAVQTFKELYTFLADIDPRGGLIGTSASFEAVWFSTPRWLRYRWFARRPCRSIAETRYRRYDYRSSITMSSPRRR